MLTSHWFPGSGAGKRFSTYINNHNCDYGPVAQSGSSEAARQELQSNSPVRRAERERLREAYRKSVGLLSSDKRSEMAETIHDEERKRPSRMSCGSNSKGDEDAVRNEVSDVYQNFRKF